MAFVRKAYTPRFARNVLKSHIIAIIVGAVGGSVYLAIARPQFWGHVITLIVGEVVEPVYVAGTRPQFLTFAISLIVVAIVAALTMAILFSRGKPAAACGVIFAGVIVWVMICGAGFSTVLDVDRPARDFARKVARIVPQSDKLVAYGAISSRFVQYFGKVVPEIQDKSLIYEHYEQGDWVVCTFDYLKELMPDDRLRKVHYGRQYGKEDTGGALFHKSAAVIENEDDGGLKVPPRLPVGGQERGPGQ
jgi:molybdopterin-binding protein